MSVDSDKDRAFHDAFARDYDRVVVAPRAVPNDILFARLGRVRRRGAMLDLGCGTGHMLVRYRRGFARALGVDHSDGMIAVARDNVAAAGVGEVNWVREDVLAFAQRCAERFDLVTCVGVLHHLDPEPRQQLLRRVGELLEPGGCAILAEPVEVDLSAIPAAVQAWARTSLGARIPYNPPAEEPDEGPIGEKHWRQSLADAGLRVASESRMWEMSAQSESPGWLERWRIARLIRRHGGNGNVLALKVVRAS